MDERTGGTAGSTEDAAALARRVRFGALPAREDPSTWSTTQPVEHDPGTDLDPHEELRRMVLLGGA